MTNNHDIRHELSPTAQQELGDLEPLMTWLASDTAPEPSTASTEHLLAQLQPHVATRREAPIAPRRGVRGWIALAWSQTTIFEGGFWWASMIIVAIGLLVGVFNGGPWLALLFVLCAPVLAAFGVALAFQSSSQTLGDLERASPTHPLELLYARLSVVLTINLILALLPLAFVWAEVPSIVLWRLVVIWLGPMCALAGVALYTSMRWGAIPGMTIPLGLWGGMVLLGGAWLDERTDLLRQSSAEVIIIYVSNSNVMVVTALVALVVGLTLIHWSGHHMRGAAHI
ncbi:MAG: hypothetical protein AAGF95_11750 [Chloroflexota bacterium]